MPSSAIGASTGQLAPFNEGEFLDLLYAAAVRPEAWLKVMERLADLIGGTSAFLSRLDVVTGMGTGLIARIDPAMPELYLGHYADKNVLSKVTDPCAYVRGWTPRVLTDEDWLPKEDFIRGEYYNDFLKPQDIHSVLMIRLAMHGTTASVLNIHRGRAREQFSGEDRKTVSRLHAHLIRAFTLSERLAADRRLDQAGAALFEGSSQALFLVDRGGRILRVNAASEALLRLGRGLAAVAGRLSAQAPAAARRLEGLIAAAVTSDRDQRTGGAMSLIPPAGGLPLLITVSPLPMGETPFDGGNAHAMICIADLASDIVAPAERLREAFGLTPAEVRVASALFTGANARQAAASLGLSPNTIHVHLARLFEKTGARRQSELMRLMMLGAGAGQG